MTIDEKYMERCLQLANKGLGSVMSNPLVGAVIVDSDEIIGEGYHRVYGEGHAEVNAINSVKDRSRLSSSTMYVSLEPCAHYGKTPPCAELIVKNGVKRVVVSATDPNPAVAGRGIEIMRQAGIDVVEGVLEEKSMEQNRVFRVNHICKRPYVILKWAQSADGFVDRVREVGDGLSATKFSNDISSVFVHKLRAQIQGIMVGTNTAFLDNPSLTTRYWYGQNPTRIVVDRNGSLHDDMALFDEEADTIVLTEVDYKDAGARVKYIKVDLTNNSNKDILDALYEQSIYSVMIEGGSKLLSSFVDQNLWDEAYVEISSECLGSGVKSPKINLENSYTKRVRDNIQHHLKNKITQNII